MIGWDYINAIVNKSEWVSILYWYRIGAKNNDDPNFKTYKKIVDIVKHDNDKIEEFELIFRW